MKIKTDTISLHEYRVYNPPDLDNIWTFQLLGHNEVDYIKKYLQRLEEVQRIKDHDIPMTYKQEPLSFKSIDELINEINKQLENDQKEIKGDTQYGLFYFFNDEEIFSKTLCITACFYKKEDQKHGSIYYSMIVMKHNSKYLLWGFNNK